MNATKFIYPRNTKKVMLTNHLGKRIAVRITQDTEYQVWLAFAGEHLFTHRAIRTGYGYDHGGKLYKTAVDRAIDLGFFN